LIIAEPAGRVIARSGARVIARNEAGVIARNGAGVIARNEAIFLVREQRRSNPPCSVGHYKECTATHPQKGKTVFTKHKHPGNAGGT